MTSTNDGKDVKSNQTGGQKGKTYYIELYKSLEAQLSSECELSERVALLCNAWRRVHTLCQHSAPTTHPFLVTWIQRHTARTVLQSEWQSPKGKNEHEKLKEAIDSFVQECRSAAASRDVGALPWESQLQARAEWLKGLLPNPWDHPVLKALLDPKGEQPTNDELLKWLLEERGLVFGARLRQLAMAKCDDLALALLTAVMDRVRLCRAPPDDFALSTETAEPQLQQPSFESILHREAGFADVWDLLTDMELVLLHKSEKNSRLIDLAKVTPLANGYQLVERLINRLESSPKEKKIWKNAKDLAILVAQVMITRCMVVPACSGVVRTVLYWCSRALVRVLAAPRLGKATLAMAAPAGTARHLHTLASAVHAQQSAESEELKPFVVELYVRAITFGMNELEKLKLKPEYKAAEARATEQTLSSWFIQLGTLLALSPRMRAECALTAFSVHPAPRLYDLIRLSPLLHGPHPTDTSSIKDELETTENSWAKDSRSQTNFVKTSETLNIKQTQHSANVMSTAILNEGEALGLDAELCQDIIVLLSGPRVKTLSWDMDRKSLLENCRLHMERTGGGTRAVTTELKYLNLDPRHYQHLPEEDENEDDIYYGIEKGYEHLVEFEPQPEEIWEDALDFEETESAESSCNEEEIRKRKKKSKSLKFTTESDSDPLSLVAEHKKEKAEKERPHSKERTITKDLKIHDDSKKDSKTHEQKKDKKERKKEKKERKKREKKEMQKPTHSMSHLVGVKVTQVSVNERGVYVTDSDYDSQGKSSASLQSEGYDERVVYDGQFSMDEIKSPNKQSPEYNMNLSKELNAASDHITKALNYQTSNKDEHGNTLIKAGTSAPIHAEASKSVLQADTKETVSRDDLKKSITKLIQFRKQKSAESKLNPSPRPTTSLSSLIGTKLQNTTNVTSNKTQTEQLGAMKNEVKGFPNAIHYPSKQPKHSPGTCSRTQPFHPARARQKVPTSHPDFDISDLPQDPTILNNAMTQYSQMQAHKPTTTERSGQNSHLSCYQQFIKELGQNSLMGLPITEDKRREIKPISRVPPIIPKAKTEPIISVAANLAPSTPKPEPAAAVPNTQCAKPTPSKKVESAPSNAPNTFARLSYMHKNKLNEKPKPEPTPELHCSVSEELDRRIAELRKTKIAMLIDKHETSLNSGNAPPKRELAKVEVQAIEQPDMTTPYHLHKEHPVLTNILRNPIGATIKICTNTEPHKAKIEGRTFATKTKQSSLTEKDQQEILKLLGQKNRMQTQLNETKTINTQNLNCTNVSQMSHDVSNKCISGPLNLTSVSKPVRAKKVQQSQAQNNEGIEIKARMPVSLGGTNIQFPVISNTTILKTTAMVQDSKGTPVQQVHPKQPKAKAKGKSTQKCETVPMFHSSADPSEVIANKEVSKKYVPKPPQPTPQFNDDAKEQDWAKVMDALRSQKTPNRGPNALEMTMNKDTNINAKNKIMQSPIAKKVENFIYSVLEQQTAQQNKNSPNILRMASTKSTGIAPHMENLSTCVLGQQIAQQNKYSPTILRSAPTKFTGVAPHMENLSTSVLGQQTAEQNKTSSTERRLAPTNSIGVTPHMEVLGTCALEQQTAQQNISSPTILRLGPTKSTGVAPHMEDLNTSVLEQRTTQQNKTSLEILRQASTKSTGAVPKYFQKQSKKIEIPKKVETRKANIPNSQIQKQQIQPQLHKKDPFISGIQNSDYDILEELLDDDLRKEISELSSDEDNYGAVVGPAKASKHDVHKKANTGIIKNNAQGKSKLTVDPRFVLDHANKTSLVVKQTPTAMPQSKPKTEKVQILSNEILDITKLPIIPAIRKKLSTTGNSSQDMTIYNLNYNSRSVSHDASVVQSSAHSATSQPSGQNMVIHDPFGVATSNQNFVPVDNSSKLVYQPNTPSICINVASQVILSSSTFIVPPMSMQTAAVNIACNAPTMAATTPMNAHGSITTYENIINSIDKQPNQNAPVLKESTLEDIKIENITQSCKAGEPIVSAKTKVTKKGRRRTKIKQKAATIPKATFTKKGISVSLTNKKQTIDPQIKPGKSTEQVKFVKASTKKDLVQVNDGDEKRIAMKRNAIINRKIHHYLEFPSIQLGYSPIAVAQPKTYEKESSNVHEQSDTAKVDCKKYSTENIRQNENTASCRRILLRSSNKMTDVAKQAENLEWKTTVRLKGADNDEIKIHEMAEEVLVMETKSISEIASATNSLHNEQTATTTVSPKLKVGSDEARSEVTTDVSNELAQSVAPIRVSKRILNKKIKISKEKQAKIQCQKPEQKEEKKIRDKVVETSKNIAITEVELTVVPPVSVSDGLFDMETAITGVKIPKKDVIQNVLRVDDTALTSSNNILKEISVPESEKIIQKNKKPLAELNIEKREILPTMEMSNLNIDTIEILSSPEIDLTNVNPLAKACLKPCDKNENTVPPNPKNGIGSTLDENLARKFCVKESESVSVSNKTKNIEDVRKPLKSETKSTLTKNPVAVETLTRTERELSAISLLSDEDTPNVKLSISSKVESKSVAVSVAPPKTGIIITRDKALSVISPISQKLSAHNKLTRLVDDIESALSVITETTLSSPIIDTPTDNENDEIPDKQPKVLQEIAVKSTTKSVLEDAAKISSSLNVCSTLEGNFISGITTPLSNSDDKKPQTLNEGDISKASLISQKCVETIDCSSAKTIPVETHKVKNRDAISLREDSDIDQMSVVVPIARVLDNDTPAPEINRSICEKICNDLNKVNKSYPQDKVTTVEANDPNHQVEIDVEKEINVPHQHVETSTEKRASDTFVLSDGPENGSTSKIANTATATPGVNIDNKSLTGNDIPQSYKDSIQIIEVPIPENTNPFKRIVKIKLPNKKLFRATVYGKMTVSFDSLFENPALKNILLNNWVDKNIRYTVNIPQDCVNTQLEQPKTVETVNLISDDEDEHTLPLQRLNTATGSYIIQHINNDIFRKHQEKLAQKCTVELHRCDERSKKKSLVEALIKDLVPSLNPICTPSSEVIEIGDSGSEDESEGLPKIDALKDKLLRDLGVEVNPVTEFLQINENSQNIIPDVLVAENKHLSRTGKSKHHRETDPITVTLPEKRSAQTMKEVSAISTYGKDSNEDQNKLAYSQIIKRKCYIELVRCDDMIKELPQQHEDNEQQYLFEDNMIACTDVDGTDIPLSRSGSYSLLNDIDAIDVPCSMKITSFPKFDAFKSLDVYGVNPNRTSPVMEVYDMIVAIQEKATYNIVREFDDDKCRSDWYWFHTKRDLHFEQIEAENNKDFDKANRLTDCETDDTDIELSDGESIYSKRVSSLQSIMAKYFKDNSIINVITPLCSKVKSNIPKTPTKRKTSALNKHICKVLKTSPQSNENMKILDSEHSRLTPEFKEIVAFKENISTTSNESTSGVLQNKVSESTPKIETDSSHTEYAKSLIPKEVNVQQSSLSTTATQKIESVTFSAKDHINEEHENVTPMPIITTGTETFAPHSPSLVENIYEHIIPIRNHDPDKTSLNLDSTASLDQPIESESLHEMLRPMSTEKVLLETAINTSEDFPNRGTSLVNEMSIKRETGVTSSLEVKHTQSLNLSVELSKPSNHTIECLERTPTIVETNYLPSIKTPEIPFVLETTYQQFPTNETARSEAMEGDCNTTESDTGFLEEAEETRNHENCNKSSDFNKQSNCLKTGTDTSQSPELCEMNPRSIEVIPEPVPIKSKAPPTLGNVIKLENSIIEIIDSKKSPNILDPTNDQLLSLIELPEQKMPLVFDDTLRCTSMSPSEFTETQVSKDKYSDESVGPNVRDRSEISRAGPPVLNNTKNDRDISRLVEDSTTTLKTTRDLTQSPLKLELPTEIKNIPTELKQRSTRANNDNISLCANCDNNTSPEVEQNILHILDVPKTDVVNINCNRYLQDTNIIEDNVQQALEVILTTEDTRTKYQISNSTPNEAKCIGKNINMFEEMVAKRHQEDTAFADQETKEYAITISNTTEEEDRKAIISNKILPNINIQPEETESVNIYRNSFDTSKDTNLKESDNSEMAFDEPETEKNTISISNTTEKKEREVNISQNIVPEETESVNIDLNSLDAPTSIDTNLKESDSSEMLDTALAEPETEENTISISNSTEEKERNVIISKNILPDMTIQPEETESVDIKHNSFDYPTSKNTNLKESDSSEMFNTALAEPETEEDTISISNTTDEKEREIIMSSNIIPDITTQPEETDSKQRSAGANNDNISLCANCDINTSPEVEQNILHILDVPKTDVVNINCNRHLHDTKTIEDNVQQALEIILTTEDTRKKYQISNSTRNDPQSIVKNINMFARMFERRHQEDTALAEPETKEYTISISNTTEEKERKSIISNKILPDITIQPEETESVNIDHNSLDATTSKDTNLKESDNSETINTAFDETETEENTISISNTTEEKEREVIINKYVLPEESVNLDRNSLDGPTSKDTNLKESDSSELFDTAFDEPETEENTISISNTKEETKREVNISNNILPDMTVNPEKTESHSLDASTSKDTNQKQSDNTEMFEHPFEERKQNCNTPTSITILERFHKAVLSNAGEDNVKHKDISIEIKLQTEVEDCSQTPSQPLRLDAFSEENVENIAKYLEDISGQQTCAVGTGCSGDVTKIKQPTAELQEILEGKLKSKLSLPYEGIEANHCNENIDWVCHETVIDSDLSEISSEIEIPLNNTSFTLENNAAEILEPANHKLIQTNIQYNNNRENIQTEHIQSPSERSLQNAEELECVYETEIVTDKISNVSFELQDEVEVPSPAKSDECDSIIVEKTITEIECDENILKKNATLVYKDESGVILKGIEYDDPQIGTCFVFPLAQNSDDSETNELLSNSINSSIEVIPVSSNIEIQNLESTESKTNLHVSDYLQVLQPKITYFTRNLKRRSNMKDVILIKKRPRRNLRTNETYQFRYRKSKKIDAPKITTAAITDLSYSKEFQSLKDYYDNVGFSYSVTYSREFIDVFELLQDWPIKDRIVDDINYDLKIDNVLYTDINDTNKFKDPLELPLVEELTANYNDANYSSDSNVEATNASVGFGERSGRVIQNLDGGAISKFSAATLSDVKQSQPFLLSEKRDDINKLKFHQSSQQEQLETIKRFSSYLKLKEKVRSFFKNTTIELSHLDHEEKDSINNEDASSFPFHLYIPKIMEPRPMQAIVQVVQVGQLPVSAAAQNPVTCDPRVTQVSNVSPSQCSVDNSPHDSQQDSRTEYTELTTADLSMPRVENYVKHNQSLPTESQAGTNMSLSTENIPIQTELLKSDMKFELADENPDEKEKNIENCNQSDGNNHANVEDFIYNTNNTNAAVEAEIQALFKSEKQDVSVTTPDPKPQNGSIEKTDQIAHAMNAAGITTTTETVTNSAQAFVNLLSQKIRQSAVVSTPNSPNNYPKTTTINAMSLQQALAQILPPPLNHTNSAENNQQTQNPVTSQVLHIVQGKGGSGNQITLVDNTQHSVINAPNATPVLHIVQNNSAPGPTSNGSPAPQQNTFSGISLVDAGLQQGGNQLLHILNTGNQKNNAASQLLKRVNLLTNLANVQGSNEQKMVQFVCKSADGKSIQLNAPNQRSMVLRLQPIDPPNVQPATPQTVDDDELSPTPNVIIKTAYTPIKADTSNTQQEIKSRSVYEENYAKFIQNSSNKTTVLEKLPKFNQAFGKSVYQDGTQKQNEINTNNLPAVNTGSENTESPPTDNAINLDRIGPISSPPLLLRKSPQTTQPQSNLVQQIKQAIAPMNLQTLHGGVIYTRQIPVNIGGGQTINLITVPSTDIVDDPGQKQQINQDSIEPSIIKIVPQSQPQTTNTEGTAVNEENAQQNPPQPQPVLTQMRIKLPMLSKNPQMVSGARVVRPSFFQIQRNIVGGANQQVYQQLVLTAAPPLGQQTIRLPQTQTRQIKTPENQSSETQMSSSTLEQLREFDMVLEQVKERSTGQPNSNSGSSFKIHNPSTDTTDSPPSATSTSAAETTQVLYSIGSNQPLNVAYVNRKTNVNTPTTSTFVRSPDSSGIADSPTSSSSQVQPQTDTTESSSSGTTTQQKVKISSRQRPRPKLHQQTTVKVTPPPKPSTQKPLEDEQTTQRILYILAEYKEQVENSPDKDKPAPRRRNNPPTNPSGSSKRKKSSSGSRRSGRDLSPFNGDDMSRTMGSEDSSCGTSQGDCNESCMDPNSPQDSPRKVSRKLTFEPEPSPTPPPKSQPQRNVIVADGQTITVARGTTGKPATAVLMPANYILPVSMVKGGQQIAIVTNRGPKLLTVGGSEGGATNALLLQRLIGPAGLKPVLARPGVRHVRLPTAALHNFQAFNFATASTAQPPDSTASPVSDQNPPDLVETNRNETSPWADRSGHKPERASSPDEAEPWNLPSSADPNDYSYEETVRAENMDRTVLDQIQDRYSPDMEAQRIFDKMFDVEAKKSYIVDSVNSPRCGYDIDASDCDDKPYQVVHRKDTTARHGRFAHVSAAALRHKYAILEHELRLQKSLSEECEDLGVDSPSASELFPEAELLFAASPAQDHASDVPQHSHTPQPTLLTQSAVQPDIDDQIATDHLLQRGPAGGRQELDVNLGLEDVGIVTVSEDGLQTTIALDHEEFARSHPNTTFHSEPTDEGEVQPYTIAGLKTRHITSTIFHSNRAPATVLMTAPQTTVISQATASAGAGHTHHNVKYSDIDNMINSIPSTHNNNVNLPSVLVKDDGLTRFDSILTDSRELHLSNTASAIVHSSGNATQVIRRVYDDSKRTRDSYLIDEPDAIIAGDDAKMVAEDSSRDATLESMGGDVDDDNSSPGRHAELFWESNSASERSESRRRLDFSSDSDKCCKSPSYDETNSTDSSGIGAHMRLDSVIKDARGIDRSGSADGSSADDTHPPLRTYPPKRLFHTAEGGLERSLSGKTRAGERSPDLEVRRRASGRGVVKRGCHCCNGSPAPSRPKKPRQRKPTMDFTN